jgi:hypothetical protein
MCGFFSSLFQSHAQSLRIDNWYLSDPIKLPRPILTGFGRRVRVVCPYVDIEYTVQDHSISILYAGMSQTGSTILGSNFRLNITAERIGEAFFVSSISPPSILLDEVTKVAADQRSALRRVMLEKWSKAFPVESSAAFCEAINAKAPVEYLRAIAATEDSGRTVEFTYDSPKRGPEQRKVVLDGFQGDLLRARDCRDGSMKTFRLDRISNVRPGPPGR